MLYLLNSSSSGQCNCSTPVVVVGPEAVEVALVGLVVHFVVVPPELETKVVGDTVRLKPLRL